MNCVNCPNADQHHTEQKQELQLLDDGIKYFLKGYSLQANDTFEQLRQVKEKRLITSMGR